MPQAISHPTAPALVTTVTDGVARITITHAARRNALDTACWESLRASCEMLAGRDDVRAVILSGEGEHFSAGADIHELSAHMHDRDWMQKNQTAIANAIDSYANLPQPTIAAIRGSCFGGGAALAAASDFRLAAEGSRFAITPAKLGLTYRLTDCLRVVDLVGSAGAREMLMLATELDGATALAWGFINELTTADQLDSRVNAWTTRITTLSGYSQRGIKATLRKIREGATADDDETRHTFRNAFESPDFMAAAVAFTNNRKS